MAEKARLEGQRVTYDDIYRETGIFPSTLSHLASGRAKRLDLSILERLCAYFRCEPGDLLILQQPVRDAGGSHARARERRTTRQK